MSGLQIQARMLSEGLGTLAVVGLLNGATAPEFKDRLKGLIAEGCPDVILDLTGVSFIDSSGLAALISGLKTARQSGGWIGLVGVNRQTRIVFETTLLDRVFEFYPDVRTALDALPERQVPSRW